MSARSFLSLLLSVPAWLPLPGAGAPELAFELDRIAAGALVAEGVSMALVLDAGSAAQLQLEAARVQLSPSLELRDVRVECMHATLAAGRIECADGRFSGRHARHGDVAGSLAFNWDQATGAGLLRVEPVRLGRLALEGTLQLAGDDWQAEFAGQNLDFAGLQDALRGARLWPDAYSDAGGNIDAVVRAAGHGRAIERAEGALRGSRIDLLGPNSAEQLDFEATFSLQQADGWAAQVDLRLLRGLLYIEPGIELDGLRPGLTLDVPERGIRLALDARLDSGRGLLRVNRFEISHPELLELAARGELANGRDWSVRELDLELRAAALQPVYATYLQPFLLGSRLDALELAGAMSATARVRDGALRELDVELSDVHVYDGNGRFSIAALEGQLHFGQATERVLSQLSWQGAGIHRLALGPGELVLASVAGDIEIVSWRDLPILDGGLRIDALSIEQAGQPDMRLRLDGELLPISMADLTQALGWPVMSGTLRGRIDGLVWSRGRLVVGGRIEVGLFGGSVVVRNLEVDDLFGMLPVLRADIDLRDIDLALLTDRFSFGRIEGRLGGGIHALELQDWQPVYFDARLETPEDDASRHRISQRAVDNLGYIGGGASGALSGGLLRYFREYSYGRLGIGCRLRHGRCELSGVADTADGFLILTRGGLLPPWIEVKGAGRSIGWSELVDGLKTIAAGRPEIR